MEDNAQEQEQVTDLYEGQSEDVSTESTDIPQEGTLQDQTVQEAQPQTDWDGKAWALKYRGNPYHPKSRDELVNLAQKGFSYSQEMARLKQEREQLQQQYAPYQHYQQFDAMLKSNPALAQTIANALSQQLGQPQQAAGQQVQQQGNGYPEALMSRIQQIETMLQQRQASEDDARLEQEINTLKSKYPNYQWDVDKGDGAGTLLTQLLQFAHDNEYGNLDHAFRIMMFDSNTAEAKAAALKQNQQARQQAQRAGVIGGGKQASPGKPGYDSNLGYNDLARMMASQVKSM